MMRSLKSIIGVCYHALPKRVKVVLIIGSLVLYNLLFIAYLLFIGGIIPYMIFFYGK